MEIKKNIENTEEWNKNQYHPYQTTVLKEIQNLDYNYFFSNDNQKYLYYLTSLWPFKIANLLLPNYDDKSIKEFIDYCNKKRYVYKITLFEKDCFLSSKEESFIQIIDTKDIKINKGARCNINKSLKEGVIVKKLIEKEYWEEQNKIHNLLMDRKNMSYEKHKREEMYYTLFNYQNKNTLLYGAFYQNKMIGGIVITYTPEYGLYTKSATLKEYYHLQPNALIIKTICEQEKDRFNYLDLNVGIDAINKSSSEIQNIIKFKKQFGEEKKVYIYMPKWFLIIKKIKKKINQLKNKSNLLSHNN